MGEETLKRLLQAEATTGKLPAISRKQSYSQNIEARSGGVPILDSSPVMSREMQEEYRLTIALGLMFPPEE